MPDGTADHTAKDGCLTDHGGAPPGNAIHPTRRKVLVLPA